MMPTTADLFFYHAFKGQSLDVTLSPFGFKFILFRIKEVKIHSWLDIVGKHFILVM